MTSYHRLEALIIPIVAGCLLSAGCGPCEPESTAVYLRLPPANPGGSTAPSFDPEEIDAEECEVVCGVDYDNCRAIILEGDVPAVECTLANDCSSGRRPPGLRAMRSTLARDATGSWLARAAHLEAASVVAFDRLAEELELHGAPSSLVRRARTAARDEVRHARAMSALAARRGARAPAPRVRPRAPRSLLAIALDNAREGCVRETFGAALAHYQAAAASAPIRGIMRRIAPDETQHAALSADIDEWARALFTERDRARVDRVRAHEASRMVREWRAEGVDSVALGLPATRVGRTLAIRLGTSLGWWTRFTSPRASFET